MSIGQATAAPMLKISNSLAMWRDQNRGSARSDCPIIAGFEGDLS
jgi:hypothetical protein